MEIVNLVENLAIENTFSGQCRGWENCPLDVLMLVFEKLDPEDLMNCILVNACWRDAVHFMGQHRGIWRQLAQAGMVNKGIGFRRRSTANWQDLYINSRLWFHLRHARLTWSYELSDHDIRHLHVYKDILIIEKGDDFLKNYYQIGERLLDVTESLIVSSLRNDGRSDVGSEEYVGYDCDRMIKKLVQEGPFKRFLVFDEDCFYLLDNKNVLRCSKWDERNKRWLDYTLARYYGCNSSISDINVYNNEVYMLLKTGLVFKLDRLGRNFIPDRRFDMSYPRELQFSRLMNSNVLTNVEQVSRLRIPEYNTGRNIMFHKISAVVSVPCDKKFRMIINTKTDSTVLECPGLTCATQHGEILFLGFQNGKVEMCIPNLLRSNKGAPEFTAKVQDCPGYKDQNPEIIGIDVFEDRESHHLFVSTNTSVYRLVITYPDHVKRLLGVE